MEQDGKKAKIYLGDFPDTENRNLLDVALMLAPSWDHIFIHRHQHGWTFVGGGDVRYAFDDGCTGWMPMDDYERLAVYDSLGRRETSIYIDFEQEA